MTWRDKARCNPWAPVDFFAEDAERIEEAKLFCRLHCPVRRECLEECLHDERNIPSHLLAGVFGGKSADDRRRMRRTSARKRRQGVAA